MVIIRATILRTPNKKIVIIPVYKYRKAEGYYLKPKIVKRYEITTYQGLYHWDNNKRIGVYKGYMDIVPGGNYVLPNKREAIKRARHILQDKFHKRQKIIMEHKWVGI